MTTQRIIVARTDGHIERHVVRVRRNQSIISAVMIYGTALQKSYADIDGIRIDHPDYKLYQWVGHTGTGLILSKEVV